MIVEQLLAQARAEIARVSPAQAFEASRCGAIILDIREHERLQRDGGVPGAIAISHNVSSLAAATLKRLGLLGATDMEGGFGAWRAAGLPVERSRSS